MRDPRCRCPAPFRPVWCPHVAAACTGGLHWRLAVAAARAACTGGLHDMRWVQSGIECTRSSLSAPHAPPRLATAQSRRRSRQRSSGGFRHPSVAHPDVSPRCRLVGRGWARLPPQSGRRRRVVTRPEAPHALGRCRPLEGEVRGWERRGGPRVEGRTTRLTFAVGSAALCILGAWPGHGVQHVPSEPSTGAPRRHNAQPRQGPRAPAVGREIARAQSTPSSPHTHVGARASASSSSRARARAMGTLDGGRAEVCTASARAPTMSLCIPMGATPLGSNTDEGRVVAKLLKK